MNVQTQIDATSPRTTEHFDVLIAGAGISGVGAAYHLTTQCPGTSFVALEAQKTFGGTWTTHRYPGIRSDSDLHTFGYRFKPWTTAPIASAAEILKYMGDMIERGKPLDHRGHAHRHRRKTSLHHQLLLDVPGLLPPHRGLYAGVEGHGQIQGPHRPSAEMARRSRLQEQADHCDRLRRYRS